MSADGQTSGQVVAVRITSDGPLALLDNEKQLLIDAGITIY
jgi:hypothetical protein